MRKKQLKLLSTCLSASMLLTAIPVSADFEISNITNGNSDEYVEYQSSDDEDFSTETSVYALIGSNYKVTIPKVIVLSGIEKKANYYVEVSGDIAGVEKVNVIPDESVELFSTNKASQIASISQDRTSWGYEDLGTKANGLVQADGLTSGKWSGTFNFNINLEGGQVLGDLVLPPVEDWTTGLANEVLELKVGQKKTIKINGVDDLTVTTFNWDVIDVQDNVIEGLMPGTATVSVMSDDKSYAFKVIVTESLSDHTHIIGQSVETNRHPATCTEAGDYDVVTYCSVCGEELYREKGYEDELGHEPKEAVNENVIAACVGNGSHDEVVYCNRCGEEISRTPVTDAAVGHNYVNGECSRCGDLELPAAGTKLSDMSFKQIKAVAQKGKTADYDIKVKDTIKVNDSIDAEIVAIGDDYIEFCTVRKIVDSTGYSNEISVGGTNIKYSTVSSFYVEPQVNNGITNSAQISYVGSNIQSEVNAWLNLQSDEFKSSLKDVEREYEVATLIFDGSNYSQTITSTIKDTEKVYIPTKAELESTYNNSATFKNVYFWTASPNVFSSKASGGSFSGFYIGTYGMIVGACTGNADVAIYAIFRIG